MPPIAVLAGGLGSRMAHLTATIPKSMLEVAGEPFIAHQLRQFHREGIRRVVLCAGHLMPVITDFVGDGARFGVTVSYSYDGEKLLGTGGALRKALPLLGREFLVIYGDSYLDIQFRPVVEAFTAGRRLALMTVLHNAGRWDTSNVEFVDGRIIDYSKQPTPKMRHIDYGLAVLRRDAFDDMPSDGSFDLMRLYRSLIAKGEMTGFEVTKRFYEIGSPSGLADTAAYLEACKKGRDHEHQ
jgi:NDP-sugar pyrophosphorylase family protein